MLRTNGDWDLDIEPVNSDPEAGRYEFLVESAEPFLYYKALVLTDDGRELWAQGPDRLATAGSSRINDTFPSFSAAEARVTEPEALESEFGTWTYRVYVPAGYDGNHLHRYPVLYMNDGQNLFSRFGPQLDAAWSVESTLTRLHEMSSIEHVIVVGVFPHDRMVDYTREGEEDYANFLAKALKPHIDAEFRTLANPEHTAIMGSSLGGVSALTVAWTHPDQFGMAGCMSSSFGYENDLRARVLTEEKPDIRVYLDSGWPRDNFEVTRDMRACLARAGFIEGLDLLYFAFPGDRHSETDWGARSHVVYQFFFGHRPYARSRAGRHAVNGPDARASTES